MHISVFNFTQINVIIVFVWAMIHHSTLVFVQPTVIHLVLRPDDKTVLKIFCCSLLLNRLPVNDDVITVVVYTAMSLRSMWLPFTIVQTDLTAFWCYLGNFTGLGQLYRGQSFVSSNCFYFVVSTGDALILSCTAKWQSNPIIFCT